MDLGWIASATPIVLGVGVGLAARRVIAANDQRRADSSGEPPAAPTAPQAGHPKAGRPLRHAVPAGQR